MIDDNIGALCGKYLVVDSSNARIFFKFASLIKKALLFEECGIGLMRDCIA